MRSVWAKHDRDSEGWLPLWRHMEDSAAVAGLLWDRWLPANVRALISGALPGGERDGQRLAVWLAGVHDVGKATPAFACQVDQLADVMRAQGLEIRTPRQFGLPSTAVCICRRSAPDTPPPRNAAPRPDRFISPCQRPHSPSSPPERAAPTTCSDRAVGGAGRRSATARWPPPCHRAPSCRAGSPPAERRPPSGCRWPPRVR